MPWTVVSIKLEGEGMSNMSMAVSSLSETRAGARKWTNVSLRELELFLRAHYRDKASSNFWCLRNASADGPELETSTARGRAGSTYSDPTCAPDNSDRLLELRRIREPNSTSTGVCDAGLSETEFREARAATRNLISSEGGRWPHSPAPVLMSTILKLWP